MARNSLYLFKTAFQCIILDLWNKEVLGALNHQIPHDLITLIDFVIKCTVKSLSINILGTARSTCTLLLDRNHKVIPPALAYYKFSNFRYFSYLKLWTKSLRHSCTPLSWDIWSRCQTDPFGQGIKKGVPSRGYFRCLVDSSSGCLVYYLNLDYSWPWWLVKNVLLK